MFRFSPAAQFLAQLTEPGSFDSGAPAITPDGAARWFQLNKVPLMAVARNAPAWLAQSAPFQTSLKEEEVWYETQRSEYALVHSAWRQRGIDCLMIKSAGNWPSFPHTSDNIDVLVPPQQGRAARETLRQLGYVELRNIEEPHKFLFRKFRGGRSVSAIHVHEKVIWLVGFMDESALWQRKQVSEDDPLVTVPSPEDAILINLAHACYENKVLKLNDVVRIRHALRARNGQLDWVYMERVARDRGWADGLAYLLLVYASVERALFGAALIPDAQRAHLEECLQKLPFARRQLERTLAASDADLPLDLSYWFCKRLYYRKILADPLVSKARRWRDVGVTLMVGIKLKSRLRPQPGMVISLSGMDGTGKTAHAEALMDALQTSEIRATHFWNRGGSTGLAGLISRLRNRRAEGETNCVDPLSRRRRRLSHPIMRGAWSWLVAIDQIATYITRAALPARLGRVVVCDRYSFDTAVEMDMSLPPGAKWSRLAVRALLALAPRPDMGFVLDVSPETARARKPDEVWHDDVETEREHYAGLARQHKLRVLSTEGDFAVSNDPLVREVMMRYMASYETWPNALLLANPSQKNPPDPIWERRSAAARGTAHPISSATRAA